MEVSLSGRELPPVFGPLKVRRSGAISIIACLVGKIVGLQEFYSTSGYLLPAAELIGEGFQLEYTAGRTAPATDRIGFFFSGDEENSLSMLQQGVIDAGAMSGLDWSRLPEEIKSEFVVITTTVSVPRRPANTCTSSARAVRFLE